jgi:hypothetical protein
VFSVRSDLRSVVAIFFFLPLHHIWYIMLNKYENIAYYVREGDFR